MTSGGAIRIGGRRLGRNIVGRRRRSRSRYGVLRAPARPARRPRGTTHGERRAPTCAADADLLAEIESCGSGPRPTAPWPPSPWPSLITVIVASNAQTASAARAQAPTAAAGEVCSYQSCRAGRPAKEPYRAVRLADDLRLKLNRTPLVSEARAARRTPPPRRDRAFASC